MPVKPRDPQCGHLAQGRRSFSFGRFSPVRSCRSWSRTTRRNVAIAGNEPFSAQTKTFTDRRLCAAIVDRLTFAVRQIIDTGSASYRLDRPAAKRAAA
jgi:hypothetical protein